MLTASFKPEKLRIFFLFLLALIISLFFFRLIENFILAILMAGLLAGLLHPFYLRIHKKFNGREGTASAVTVLLTLTLVIVPMIAFTIILVTEAVGIGETASDWVNQKINQPGTIEEKLQDVPALKKLLPYQDSIINKAGELAAKASAYVIEVLAAGAMGTASFLMSLFVMLYAMFYFLPKGGDLLHKILSFTPLLDHDKERLLRTFTTVTRASLKGTLFIGIIQGSLAGLSFAVVGIKGAIFWGTVMAVASMVPMVGTSLVWIPAVIYLAINGQTVEAIGIGLWCSVVVGTVDNVLRPILIGKDTNMPDLLVFISILGGLAMFGAIGIFIGPVIGALFIAIWDIWGAAVEETRSHSPAAEPNK